MLTPVINRPVSSRCRSLRPTIALQLWRRAMLILATVAALLAVPGLSLATTGDGADAFVKLLGNDAIQMLKNKDLTQPQREAEFRRLFVKGFDVNVISRFALGRFWREATEAQRSEYQKLFEDFIVKSYAARLGQYSGETFSVKDAKAVDANDNLVESVIERPNGPPVRVDWRVRRSDGDFKIVDVIVEGVSMVVTQRQEFGSVIQNNGGKIDSLLDRLRQKNAEIK